MNNGKILAVFAHGDDEVLGMGGALYKLSKNNDITVVICRGMQDERTEQQFHAIDNAKEILGYKSLIKLNYTEEYMSHNQLEVFKKLEEIVTQQQPDTIFIPFWGDVHQDHLFVFNHMIRASRTWGFASIKRIFCCEIISSTDQGFPQQEKQFNPNFYIPLTKEDVEVKTKALKVYSGEINKHPHPRSVEGIVNKALQRGSECKNEFAEAFLCIKYVYEGR